jgi:NADPH:quinone reductase-like Zn-dependent oxidoreductase
MAMPLQELIDQIAAGKIQVNVGRTFHLDDIVEADRLMEANAAVERSLGSPSAVVVNRYRALK